MGRYSNEVQASSRSGTGQKSRICTLPFNLGTGDNERIKHTAGEVDRTADGSASGRLIPRYLCLINGDCGNCTLAQLYEMRQE